MVRLLPFRVTLSHFSFSCCCLYLVCPSGLQHLTSHWGQDRKRLNERANEAQKTKDRCGVPFWPSELKKLKFIHSATTTQAIRPYKVRSVASAQSQPARDSHKTTVYPVGPISLCINLYSSSDSYRWPLVNFFEKCTPRRLFIFPFPQFCVICEKDSPSVPFGALSWSWGVE